MSGYQKIIIDKQAKEKQDKYIKTAPLRFRNLLHKAYNSKSRTMAVKAHCIECAGFQVKEAIYCSVPTCPLFKFNPYRIKLLKDKQKSENKKGLENEQRTN